MQESEDPAKTCHCPYPDCGLLSPYHERAADDAQPAKAYICPGCSRPFSARSSAAVQKLLAAHSQQLRRFEAANRCAPRGALTESAPCPSLFEPDPEQQPLIVVVDNIRSLHNVGAVFRTADAAGFSYIYLCGLTGVPPRNEIAKVSLGAENWIPYRYEMFLPAAVAPLKAKGYQIVALEKCPGSIGLREALEQNSLHLPLALILGNEVGGLSHEGVAMADYVCHLNMRGQKESLNVSVAFGVASYFLAEYLL